LAAFPSCRKIDLAAKLNIGSFAFDDKKSSNYC
jgi:hypothetical protein